MRFPSVILSLPRKLRVGVYLFIQPLVVFSLRSSGIAVGRAPKFYGLPLINRHSSSEIVFGDRVVFCSDSRFTALALNHPVKISTIRANARLTIGNDVGLSGACIICANQVHVGSEVLMGANVLIVDTDFHPIEPKRRRFSDDEKSIRTAPVHVGNNVFIGAAAILLKGVRVGDDSVIAAGAVVSGGEYPAGVILAGNPAKIIGSVY